MDPIDYPDWYLEQMEEASIESPLLLADLCGDAERNEALSLWFPYLGGLTLAELGRKMLQENNHEL